MTFKSGFAILDVTTGRAKLGLRLARGENIPVVIHGTISGLWQDDDGISMEFEVDVKSVKELKRKRK